MPGRKIANADDARTCLELAAANGLTPSAWAYVNGIDGRSLHMWRLNLERTKAEGARSTVTGLRLVELVADTTTSDRRGISCTSGTWRSRWTASSTSRCFAGCSRW